jgi:hypothetical protein
MRLKLLLFLCLLSGALFAQEAYRNLIISEIRANDPRFNYVELTNMGTKTVNLAEFELGNNDPWTNAWLAPANRRFRLPNTLLAPGKSYLIVSVDDVPLRIWPFDPQRYLGARTCTPELRAKADLEWHFPTTEWGSWAAYDSISPSGELTFDNWGGRSAVFLRHYFVETPTARDSAIVDVFNANFNASASPYKPTGAVDAAGVTGATGNRILVRKFTVTEGTGDAIDSWTRVAGVDITDSEWLPLRFSPNDWNIAMKKEYWTQGNHGNYVLNAASVKGKTAATVVDFTNKTITVPWGVRRNDQFSNNFVYSPGLAWYYSLSGAPADSAYASARTNDTISFYAVGNTLQEIKFKVIALPSTNTDNIVVPKVPMSYTNAQYRGTYVNMGDYCGITTGLAVDTILAGNYVLGIGFASRTDSLMKYLEKPTQASWQFVFVDGVTRADLKTGDKLKVTAGNGSVKEYYIKIDKYVPSKIARLSAITWPDIPVDLKGIFGWTGDTIPLFSGTMFDYVVEIPAATSGMPALVPKAEMLNTTIDVVRATNLAGSLADKTVTFNTTAEDGTTTNSYRVTMNKQKAVEDVQPNSADPFISDLIYRDQWASTMIQVVNPGNQVLDMSNYMFVWGYINSPAAAISGRSQATDWANRYEKYIPGYKWVNQATWETKPGMVIQDLAVNPIVEPGKVFSVGDVRGTGQSNSVPTFPWGGKRVNVDIATGRNPWGETVPAALTSWHGANYYLFRIDNDSIKMGLKAAIDPNDFTLIDVFGSGDGTNAVIAGRNIDQIMSFTRKPEIYKGNTAFKGSFGTSAATSEWTITDRPYWVGKGYGWPRDILMVASFIGSHFMNEVTAYKSTVNSVAYKISEGYSMKETIRGVKASTSVDDFLARILKANPAQKLTLTSATTGKVLKGADVLANADMLEVLSADTLNKSKYILNVTVNGLSTNAKLTSSVYFISIDVSTGGVYLVPKNTKVTAAIANVKVPEGATLTVIDDKNAWVPFKTLNFDTTYVDVMVTDKIFFEVVAEDGVTKIRYQLFPDTKPAEAYVLSDIYFVDQTKALIQFVPRGTTVKTLLSNLFPAPGATVKVVDKAGIQRTSGGLYQDDMVVVTSKDGKVTKVYYLDMLQTQFVTTAYLAYVLSDVFTVDQLNKMISKPLADSPKATFLSKLTPAFGATMTVYNKNGVPSTTTVLKRGDVLRVTSADGKVVNNYVLELDGTLIDQLENGVISVYPNPTSGEINISGVKAGNRIRVTNLLGSSLLDRVASSSLEVVSIDDQPSGLYFITVSNAERVVGNFKLVKR